MRNVCITAAGEGNARAQQRAPESEVQGRYGASPISYRDCLHANLALFYSQSSQHGDSAHARARPAPRRRDVQCPAARPRPRQPRILRLAPSLPYLELGPYYVHPAPVAEFLLRVLVSTPAQLVHLRLGIVCFSSPQRAQLAHARTFGALRILMVPHGKGMLSTRDLFFLLSLMPALEALWVCTKDMCVPGYWDDGPPDLGSWYVRDACVLDTPACKLRYYRCASPFVGWELPVAGSLDSTRDLELKLGWAVDCAQDAAILLRIAPCLRSLVIHIDDSLQARFLLPALEQCGRLRTLKLFVARRSFSAAAAALALFGALAEAGCRLTALEFDPALAGDVLSAFANGQLLETSGCLRALRVLRLNMWTADLDDLCDAVRQLERCCAARKVRLDQVLLDS